MIAPTVSSRSRAVRDRLRAMLPTADEPDESQPTSRKSLAMLLSLVVAIVMWFSFSMRETYPLTMRLPVEVVRTPDGQSLREAPLTTATVTLQAEGWTLLSLIRNPPGIRVEAERATVDLGAALRESGLPAGVQIQSVQPQTIELALDTQTQRRLPIRLRRRLAPEAGYDLLHPPVLTPDSVTVTGSQTLLGSLDAWPTDVLEADGVSAPFTETVALADTLGGLLTPAVRSTRVHLDVGEFSEGTRVLPVLVENLPPEIAGVRFSPSSVRATYRAPTVGDDYDEAASSGAFRAVVDWFDIARVARDSSGGSVPVSPRWPSSLDVRDVTLAPSRVEYFIQRPARPDGE